METPTGRRALRRLGKFLVEEWKRQDRHEFPGDVDRMSEFVDYFLSRLRADFPNVLIADTGGPSTPGYSQRIGLWDGNLARYLPKEAIGISYDHTVSISGASL